MLDEYAILDKAKSLGISAEIFRVKSKGYSVHIEKEQKTGFNLSDVGFSLRVVKDGKVGFAYSTILDDRILERALESMKSSSSDPDYSLPYGKKVSYLNGLYFKEVEDPYEKVKEYMEKAEELKETVNLTYVNLSTEIIDVKVINTEGVDVNEKRSLVYFGISCNYETSNGVSPEVYESAESRRFDINVEDLKHKLESKIKMVKERKVHEIKGKDVVFTVYAQANLFTEMLNFSFSGENYFRKRTPFKLNEAINPKLEITDSPHYEQGIFSRSFDAEGMPTIETKLINNEVKSFLTNYYWSRKTSLPHTASASRSIHSLPSISTSNLILDYKEKGNDVYSDSIVVDSVQGTNTVNQETGEFSVVASVAWFNDGKTNTGLRELVITGDLKTMLSNIVLQSNKREKSGPLISADLRIKNLSVII
ncbi:TldD/PmbA family protein [Sulfuracidifex metallicus]|uniref:TldD/PmbA family protein n=1 Tax=Sulfuracidifex metallicus TaxID=47303 RepID=UPI00227662A7|nr:TldD/PmbA family protein [Sulfuracidifex metallicus]MCY0849881.1 TldD/PmbA family protein [Sulfuracidifex metallicus]